MFQRIAIVNRGEAAMRLIHAVRDLNAQAGPGGHRIETVALHTEADRSAMFVREADAAYDLGPASLRPYLDHAVLERALLETGADAAWVGWGFVAEDPTFAELCERIGVTFIGPSPEAMRRLGDKIGSKLIAEEVGVPVAPWSRGGVDTLDDAIAAAARIGYPLMLKATAGGGGRGIRKVDDRRRAVRRLRAHPRRGAAGLRVGRGVPREARHRGAARRGAGHRRRPGLGVGDRRARLLGAAPQPEGHRGVGLAGARRRPGRRAQGVGRAARHRRGLRRCRHRRVPLPPARPLLRLPRGQHPPPGRAPDHRGRHRHRPGAPADPRRVGRPAQGAPPRRGRARRRGPAQRRGPRPRLRPGARAHRAPRAAGRPRHPGRHRCGRGRLDPRRLRLDDREDHRARSRPRRGAGPAAPRDARDDGRHRGRRHQQVVHPRPARPARGRRRLGRHRLDRPGARRGPPRRERALGRRPRRRRHRGVRGGRGGRAHPAARDRPRRPAAGAARRGSGHRPQAARHRLQGHGLPHRAVALPGVGRGAERAGGHGRGRPRADRPLRQPGHRRRSHPPARHRVARTGPARRGRRRHPPGQPRRGRHPAFSRTGPRRRHPAGGG